MLSRRSRARPCGLDGACEHNSQARFKVSQGACTRQGPQLLPNPTRARQPGRAQTSSALTRLTVKAQQNLLAVWRGLRAPVLRAGSLGEAHSLAAESSERGSPPLIRAKSAAIVQPSRKKGGEGPVATDLLLCLLVLLDDDGVLFCFVSIFAVHKESWPEGAVPQRRKRDQGACTVQPFAAIFARVHAGGARPSWVHGFGCCRLLLSLFWWLAKISAATTDSLVCGHGCRTLAPPGPPSNLTLR
jgi:hypothetical protein